MYLCDEYVFNVLIEMAYKCREEIVGKRFLSVCSGFSKLKSTKISEWGWRAGVIRASTHKDSSHPDLQVNRVVECVCCGAKKGVCTCHSGHAVCVYFPKLRRWFVNLLLLHNIHNLQRCVTKPFFITDGRH